MLATAVVAVIVAIRTNTLKPLSCPAVMVVIGVAMHYSLPVRGTVYKKSDVADQHRFMIVIGAVWLCTGALIVLISAMKLPHSQWYYLTVTTAGFCCMFWYFHCNDRRRRATELRAIPSSLEEWESGEQEGLIVRGKQRPSGP